MQATEIQMQLFSPAYSSDRGYYCNTFFAPQSYFHEFVLATFWQERIPALCSIWREAHSSANNHQYI